MGTYEQTLETNKTINYKVVVEKDQESRDICFVIIDDVLVNIFAIAQYSETITIPDWVKVIKSNAVMDMADSLDPQGLECGALVIPWCVEKIEGSALKYMAVDSITLDPENHSFTLKDGSLYTRDEKTLVLAVWPDGRDRGWPEYDCFYVPEGTEEIADGALDNIWFEKLMIPDSVVRFGDLAHCEVFMEDCEGDCAVCASAGSPAQKYCEDNGIPFKEWDGSKEREVPETKREEPEGLKIAREKVSLEEAQVGETVLFGAYPQKEKGEDSTPIEWLVLEKKENRMLLLSRYGLDCQAYHANFEPVTWENCSLRKWLNMDFLNKAFDAEDKKRILRSVVQADGNPYYETDSGNDMNDEVFLLSDKEVEKYFQNDRERICQPTENAKKEVYTANGACWWWLRSPGGSGSRYAAGVSAGGSVHGDGYYVILGKGAVRPALWIDLQS